MLRQVTAKPVLIVGAGLSGLACALRLQDKGIPFQIFEASDSVGGRVRTDLVDGFFLDHGFQVYLNAYPNAGKLLDLPALDLKKFEPGALVFDGQKLHRVMDVFRRPSGILSSAFAPIGTLLDKLRVAHLRFRLTGRSVEELASTPDQETAKHLVDFGFSKGIIDSFFRSFYGGIFLENELHTSSRMFEFTFKMFSEGSATLPAAGMQAIPNQLAARLPNDCLHLNSPVASVSRTSLTLTDGQLIEGSQVVIATEASATAKLVSAFQPKSPAWRSVTDVTFSTETSPTEEGIIVLNGSGRGLVNNVCVLSKIAPTYAPKGQSLISASVLGMNESDDLPSTIKAELAEWFGPSVEFWQHLHTRNIRHALPEQSPGSESSGHLQLDGIHICGDHTHSASIEGAITSGQLTAEAVILA